MYKNNNVVLQFYRYRRSLSFICRELSSVGTHVHFAVVPYTPVLGKEVKWDSEITTTWLTSGTFLTAYNDTRNDTSDILTTAKRIQWAKKTKCLFWIPPLKSLQFPTFLRADSPSRVHWGHARRYGNRSLEMLTVERADYTQEIDCHYFDSW